MADINHLITLGIGTPGDIEHFILVGLNGVAVAAPVEGDSGGGGGGGDGPTRPRYIRIGPPARLIRLRGGIGARGQAEGRLSVERPLPAAVGTRLMLGGTLYAERRIGGGSSAGLHVQAAIQIETWAQREAGLRAELVEAQREKRMMESAMRALRTQLDDARAGVEAEEELIISLIMR